RRLLPAGHAHLLRAFAATGVGLRALAAGRQAAPVTQAAVGADLHPPPEDLRALPPQVALDRVGLDRLAKLDDLVLGQVTDARVGVDSGLGEDLPRGRAADPV